MKKIREIEADDISSLIPYIRSREAARYLHEKYPETSSERRQSLLDFAEIEEIGSILWSLEEPFYDDYILGEQIAKTKNKEVILSYFERTISPFGVVFDNIMEGNTNIVPILLNEGKFSLDDIEALIKSTLYTKGDHLDFLFPKLPLDYDMTSFARLAIMRARSVKPFLLYEERISIDDTFALAVSRKQTEWINFLFPKIDPTRVHEETIGFLIRDGHQHIIEKLLLNEHISLPLNAVRRSTFKPEILLLLLKDGRSDPTYDDNGALRTVIDIEKQPKMLRSTAARSSMEILLADERVRETMDSVSILMSVIDNLDLFTLIFEIKDIGKNQKQNIAILAVTSGSRSVLEYLLPHAYDVEDLLRNALLLKRREMIDVILDFAPHLDTKALRRVMDEIFSSK